MATMTARDQDRMLQLRAERVGIQLSLADANTLRRAERTLQRWGELECGDGNAYQSWSIERDEDTGKPRMWHHLNNGKSWSYPVADREAGAIKRINALTQRLGLHWFYQSDPRGCTVYISNEPLTDSDYNRGLSVCN